MLEDSLRVGVRTRLYGVFRHLGEFLISRHTHGLALKKSDLRRFKRLFLFFWALEHYWPGPARKRLEEKFLPLARDVVWPRLGLPQWREGDFAAALSPPYTLVYLRDLLADQLRATLSAYGIKSGGYRPHLH